MILESGSFNVADYRKAIPAWVKVQVILDKFAALACRGVCIFTPNGYMENFDDARTIQFDHDPALTNRPFDTVAQDFIPPQNDPAHIVARHAANHLEKTTGRKAGAAVTVTTRGSDVGERSRTSDIRASEAVHLARLAAKAGRTDEATKILASARLRKKHTRPKTKIASRPNAWPKGRTIPSRKRGNNHESRNGRYPKIGG